MAQVKDAWRGANRASWDERVGIHLQSEAYDLAPLRAGAARLHPIEEAELGPVSGQSILHLQCHFGRDSLTLAQRGAVVVGLDFSEPAIAAARALADETGLTDRARFVQADVYDAPVLIGAPAAFDRVFVTWGTICWLPDIVRWAEIVAHFLKPGGRFYFADSHPAALVFDDQAAGDGAMPGWFVPYLQDDVVAIDEASDYADATAVVTNTPTYEWMHPISAVARRADRMPG